MLASADSLPLPMFIASAGRGWLWSAAWDACHTAPACYMCDDHCQVCGGEVLGIVLTPVGLRVRAQIRPDRQTLLWSATWPREVQGIAREFLREPYQVTIGSTSLKARPS